MCAFVVRYHPGVYCTKFIVCLFGLTFRSHHVCSGDASVYSTIGGREFSNLESLKCDFLHFWGKIIQNYKEYYKVHGTCDFS